MLIFVDICSYLLIFVDICSYLLIFVHICFIFVHISWYLLIRLACCVANHYRVVFAQFSHSFHIERIQWEGTWSSLSPACDNIYIYIYIKKMYKFIDILLYLLLFDHMCLYSLILVIFVSFRNICGIYWYMAFVFILVYISCYVLTVFT